MQGMRLYHAAEGEVEERNMSTQQVVGVQHPLKYNLPAPLVKPFKVNKFFKDEHFDAVRQQIYSSGIGTDKMQYHPFFARWELSGIQFSDEIETFCLKKARELYNDESLVKAYFFAVRYQIKDGCVPHLWKHYDQNGTQTTIDIVIDNSAEWDLVVEGERFVQKENDAVIFCGQQHVHSRPPYPTRDESKYITVLFLHYTQPNHWIQQNKSLIREYGNDANFRFFNKFRYLPTPDKPIEQPICKCHDYANMLNLYTDIFNDDSIDSQELAHTKYKFVKVHAPGIEEYSIDIETAELLYGLAKNAFSEQWTKAKVLNNKNEVILEDSRNCYSYGLSYLQNDCHPNDPITRFKNSVETLLEEIVLQFRSKYSIMPLISHSTEVLRYEHGGKFKKHIDDCSKYPRVVSVSLIMNDEYDGGELYFPHFDISIKPTPGQIIVFASSFPYMHEVKPVLYGTRMSVVKWFDYVDRTEKRDS